MNWCGGSVDVSHPRIRVEWEDGAPGTENGCPLCQARCTVTEYALEYQKLFRWARVWKREAKIWREAVLRHCWVSAYPHPISELKGARMFLTGSGKWGEGL